MPAIGMLAPVVGICIGIFIIGIFMAVFIVMFPSCLSLRCESLLMRPVYAERLSLQVHVF